MRPSSKQRFCGLYRVIANPSGSDVSIPYFRVQSALRDPGVLMPTVTPLHRTDAGPVESHLLRLDTRDRSLRFAAGLVTDETIACYVARIPFGHDAVLGLRDDHGSIVGLAHGCLYAGREGRLHVEMAFSIDVEWRGQGFGALLMRRLEALAAAKGASALVGMCVARNLPMRRIFEHAGMQLTREDDELHDFLAMRPGVDTASHSALSA